MKLSSRRRQQRLPEQYRGIRRGRVYAVYPSTQLIGFESVDGDLAVVFYEGMDVCEGDYVYVYATWRPSVGLDNVKWSGLNPVPDMSGKYGVLRNGCGSE